MEKKTFTIGIVVSALVTAIVIGGMSSSVMAQTPCVIRVTAFRYSDRRELNNGIVRCRCWFGNVLRHR